MITQRLREGALIGFIAFALILLISLTSYDQADPGWSHTGSHSEISNAAGAVGAWFADLLVFWFGTVAYLFPAIVAYWGWALFRDIAPQELALQEIQPHSDPLFVFRWLGFLLTLLSASGLGTAFSKGNGTATVSNGDVVGGGVIGAGVNEALFPLFGPMGALLLLVALFLMGVTLFTGLSWLALLERIGQISLGILLWHRQFLGKIFNHLTNMTQADEIENTSVALADAKKQRNNKKRKVSNKPGGSNDFAAKALTGMPAISLLDPPLRSRGVLVSKQRLEHLGEQVELKLADFNIEVKVVASHPGPVITRLELDLAPGVKVSRISALAKDLARSLKVVSVRVVEVIPGKSVIGLELPNEKREMVRLSEIIDHDVFKQGKSTVSMVLGKDIAGLPIVVDLAKMPHLLVAGTTGSGKSVGVNCMLISLLYKSGPEDVRLILIDPKMLELSIYEGIPHLLTPVVTDMKDAANALRWSVAEMDRRYQLMAAMGVRNLTGFNRKITEAAEKGEPLSDPLWKPSPGALPPVLETLPTIVVVVDEFADMIMIVGKKVEELIARIAQKARAAGIHLILATQRPSVDVITGLIKANIPTRIAFQVSSRIDSRTILDQQGAESLLGAGDMLYLPPGTGIPIRVHGAFVDDHEVHNVVDDWRKRGQPEYIEAVLQSSRDNAENTDDESDAESDPLYDQAVQIVTDSRKASISSVQRRLKVGYNRAARMIEAMEAAGVVGPMQSNGSREVIAPPPV